MAVHHTAPPAGAGLRTPEAPIPPETPILVPGKTCWRIARADRLALIVDAAAYFAAAKAAMGLARHRLMMVGWDFDLRIRLEPDREDARQPDMLGRFVQHLVQSRPGLQAFILKWDMAMVKTIAREIVPLLVMQWLTMRRIHFRLDSEHPLDACHHQKLMVIDDALAFCGGIDMTRDRWDTPEHRENDPCRVEPDGTPYEPFHDVAALFDGDAAVAMGDLARRRWRRAGGRRLPPVPPPSGPFPWPDGVAVAMRNVDVAIARTEPDYDGHPLIDEIKELYVAALSAARRTIYLESQYLSSRAIREVLVRRLEEPGGPEVVVVNPQHAEGWLERWSMDAARSQVVGRLRRADRHDRLRLFYPVNAAGTPIYVHAKVMVIDDRLLRLGSSNLNNRSMGFDTECDVAVDAAGQPDEPAVRRAIIAFRNRLLAEHLGVPPEDLAAAIDARGSLVAAIDALRRDEGRSLRPLEVRDLGETEASLVDLQLFNPESRTHRERRLVHAMKKTVTRYYPLVAGLAAGVAVGLALRRRRR
ncbi:phospholipase D-like domain-containing protein [Azospirillum halopraeferens]|uniref:phospholipase D-like domain-containing protein n=1 Tax=Azospirillum halopraeferens TaxID=34010 RepID=UPI0004185B61|nr:phospholipase D-like domain-containing protein [Azospirillum halopraeferens]